MTFTFEPGLFTNLTSEQRVAITRILRLASAKVIDANAKVPRTVKGVEAKALLNDGNDMLMDLHTAVLRDADLITRSDGTKYRVDFVTEDGVRYASVARWEPEHGAWRQSFSIEVKDLSDADARQHAAKHILRIGG